MTERKGELLGVRAARRLAELGRCEIEPGLRDAEFDRIEREFGFEFADDHRAFLATGLPISKAADSNSAWKKPWPNWRDGDPDQLRRHLDREMDFLIENVRQGNWTPCWGPRPDDPEEALATARRLLSQAPRMVPIYGHRYLPAGRGTFGHPVLSMWGLDIICYGRDIIQYVNLDFGRVPEEAARWGSSEDVVPFWRDLVAWNDGPPAEPFAGP